jgi:ubiquinone/menaquinone biosynthesis C-methylase UbiE
MAGANSDLLAMRPHPNALPAKIAALERGTPQYYALREAIFQTGQGCLLPQSRVLDLSCGQGDFVEMFIERNEDLCRFVLLDRSPDNVRACAQRFHFRAHLGFVTPGGLDLAHGFPALSSRLMLCVMGLGPLDEARREEVLRMARKHLEKGGSFILVEELKDEGSCASWLTSLTDAGFKDVERIWYSGRMCAWVARK